MGESDRDLVRNYFTGKNSDFGRLLDGQYSAQQDASADGAVPKPQVKK